MIQKYLFLCLIVLIVITGCIEIQQTQADKVGWDQIKYEEYSAYYDILRPAPGRVVTQSEYNAISKGMTIDEWLISIPKDKNEFENTWYLVFYHIKKAQDTRPVVKDCSGARYEGGNPAVDQIQCQADYRALYIEQVDEIYSKAADYREKIEDLSPTYNPLLRKVSLNRGQRNFTTIKGAIYAANEGDIISLGEGKYSETLLIKKTGISIIGANKEKVIIENGGVIVKGIHNVTVSGLTIQQTKESDEDFFGIILRYANNITVTNMIIINKSSGIILESSNNNTISDNDIKSSSRFGIQLSKSYDNKIYNNNFQNNKVGVYGWQARGNQLFSNNFIENDDDGFWNSSATYPMNISNYIGMEFVLIPAGEFDMGSSEKFRYIDNEEPVHHVKFAKAFYMSKYEIIQREWREIMGNNPSNFTGDELPVESVSWNEVQEFIKKLNEKENIHKYRLPSEAEWEYAARAGSSTRYTFGGEESKSKLGDYAWYDENSGRKTHPIGQKKPNMWGLYDMHGNVWEWVQDKYQGTYDGAPIDGRAWESGVSTNRVVRGGGWNVNAIGIRSAIRSAYNPDYYISNIGFRLVRDV